MRMAIKSPIVLIIIGIFIAIAAFSVGKHHTQRIVFINMHEAIEYPALLASRHLPKDKQDAFMSAYTKALPGVIAKYAKDQHVSVVSAVVVADQGVDATQVIIDKTIDKVQKKDNAR